MQTHRGRIKLADGDEVDVDLEMTDESIRLATDATEIGTWARAEFRIVPMGGGVFEIVIDGDRVAFEPLDVEPFELSMIAANGVVRDQLASASGAEKLGNRSDAVLLDEMAEELEARGSGGGDSIDATGAPDLGGLEADADSEAIDAGATTSPGVSESADAVEDPAPADMSELLDGFPALSPGGELPGMSDSPADGAGDDPLGEFDAGEHAATTETRGETEDELTERDDHDVAEADDGWTAGDVFLDDPDGGAGPLAEGDMVPTWALVTPGERPSHQEEDAGEELPTGHRFESGLDEGGTQGDEGREQREGKPDWPGLGYDHVDEPEESADLSVARSDHTRQGIPAFDDDGAVAASGPRAGSSDVVMGAGDEVPHSEGLTADTSEGSEMLESGSTTGWNYEVLARALAELEESPGAQGEVDQPEADASRPADPEQPAGGRFGGSSLERLSAAVGSLKDRRLTPAEEALAEAAVEEAEQTGSVADGILASQRSLRQTTIVTKITWDLVRKVGAGVLLGIGIAAVVVLAPDAWEVLTREPETPVTVSDPGEVEPTTITTPATTGNGTSTTIAPESTTTTTTTEPVPVQTVFDFPAPQFVQAWNDVAGPIDPVLTFAALPPIGEFENEFFSHLSMFGVVGADGTVDRFSLVIDPTGPANSDRLGIQSLGVALKVMDPTSTGSSRAALLRSLGLDVSEPNLAGIDSSLDVDGIRYSLRYDSESVTLTLSVAPEGLGGE